MPGPKLLKLQLLGIFNIFCFMKHQTISLESAECMGSRDGLFRNTFTRIKSTNIGCYCRNFGMTNLSEALSLTRTLSIPVQIGTNIGGVFGITLSMSISNTDTIFPMVPHQSFGDRTLIMLYDKRVNDSRKMVQKL